MGVDSGLPDFRGSEGFWKAYPALAKAKINFSDVASPRTFQKDPKLAWGFYGHRLALYRKTEPHDGFRIMRQWSERIALGSWVFTSNVDGNFQKAGFPENRIDECHGSIHHLQCMTECGSGVWSADDFSPEVNDEECQLTNTPPSCPKCGTLARPNIMMFGDWNWVSKRNDIQLKNERRWLKKIGQSIAKVVVIEIGAGTTIPSVRDFSDQTGKRYGARIIRINPKESQVTNDEDVSISLAALAGLQGIDAALKKIKTWRRSA